jgi:hypothetical protein
MNMMPQRPIAADAETESRHPALGLVIVAAVAIALWAVIIEAIRLFG